MLEIKKGNKITLEILVKDEVGNTIINLSTANDILYMIKVSKTDLNADALVSKNLVDGVTANSPSTGYITVVLDPSDTESLDAATRFHALQIEYSATDIKEINLSYANAGSDGIIITQDVIRT